MADNHARTVERNDAEHRKMLIGVIPAVPGWFRVDIYEDGTTDTYTVPVIAWELLTYDGKTVARAVCFESPCSGDTHAILAPDGKVYDPEICSWPDVAAYAADKTKPKAQSGT